MAYTEKQKSEHIRELQRYLFGISQKDSRIPPVYPDGRYGKETEAAVSIFQRYYGLPVTGEVNRQRWDAIVSTYRSITYKPIAVDVFPAPDYVMRLGDSGNLVLQLQLMLFALAAGYSNIPEPEENGIYGKKTEEAIKTIQEMALLEQTGETDIETWNRIAQWFSREMKK